MSFSSSCNLKKTWENCTKCINEEQNLSNYRVFKITSSTTGLKMIKSMVSNMFLLLSIVCETDQILNRITVMILFEMHLWASRMHLPLVMCQEDDTTTSSRELELPKSRGT